MLIKVIIHKFKPNQENAHKYSINNNVHEVISYVLIITTFTII